MLKDFTNDWGNSYSAIIVQVSFVAGVVFHNWYYCALLELMWNTSMHQHPVEEVLKSPKKLDRRVEKMLSMNLRIIAGFAVFHAKYCVENIIKGEPIGRA